MSTDRELLEFAAKADGLGVDFNIITTDGATDRYGHQRWNPLADDGDALRLLVRLKMDIDFNANDVDVWHWVETRDDAAQYLSVSLGNDSLSAVRISITRAAAEIGRAMP
jgi:hypothetical protein